MTVSKDKSICTPLLGIIFLQVQFSMGFEWNLLRETKYYITRCFFRLSLTNLFQNKKRVIFNFYNIEIFIMTLFMRTLSHWECIMKQTLFVPRKIIFPFTCILCFFLCSDSFCGMYFTATHDDLCKVFYYCIVNCGVQLSCKIWIPWNYSYYLYWWKNWAARCELIYFCSNTTFVKKRIVIVSLA